VERIIREGRDANLIKKFLELIKKRLKEYGRDEVTIMHVCGTHQDTLVRYGLLDLFKENGVNIRQGPGCPVCVTTEREIQEAITLAEYGIDVAVYGDLLKVPTRIGTLHNAKGNVHVVYSITDAVKIAHDRQEKDLVFFACGFETTAPSTAITILNNPPNNFYILSAHRYLLPALEYLLSIKETKIEGIIEPGHVSTIIGTGPYIPLSERYHIPQVIAGFEPLDLVIAVYMLVDMVCKGKFEVKNEYKRVVRDTGNPKAIKVIKTVFGRSDIKWRGFPMIKGSLMSLNEEYRRKDAREVFSDILQCLSDDNDEIARGCRCGELLRGLIDPEECKLFADYCNPRNPMGPCMVTFEGGCNIAYRYRKKR